MLFHISTAAIGFCVCSPALQGVFLREQDALKGWMTREELSTKSSHRFHKS